MKKLFSILLTVAMLLSAVAFPAVVSAEGEKVTLSFVINKEGAVVGAENPVYPGDIITVDVMATADVAFTANYSNFFLKYDAAKLTKTALADNFTETTVGQVSYVNDTVLEITAEGTKLGTLTFTVNNNAVGSAAFTFASTVNFPSFIIGDGLEMYEAEYAVEDATVAFAASSAVPKIKIGEAFEAIPVSGATYNDDEKLVVKADEIKGNVTVTLSSEALAEDADLSDGREYEITEGGDYTITVVPVGGETKAYTFTFAKYLVDATLKIANPTDGSYADGYAAGEKFTMPVTISGLGEALASMIKFTVEFDANALEFDGFDEGLCEFSVVEGVYTVIYNKNAAAEYALANDAKVADLSFTVKDDAEYGTQTVKINAEALALVTKVVNPDDSDIGTAQATATATIVPAEGTAFATVADNQVGFTNAAYNVVVTPVSNAAESKVYYSANALDEMNAENMFTNGDDLLESNNFTVNATGYYYVVTKIGTAPAVYEVADAVVSKYDGTAPVIAPIADAETWTSTLTAGYTLNVTVTDEGGSDVAKLEYKLSDDAEYVASASTDEIALEAGTSAEKIWLKATDVAGNESAEKVVVIKIDGEAPTATLEAGTQANGAVPFTITVGDNLSGIKSVVVMKDGEVAQDVTEVADYAYSTTKNGTYTVVVTDNADNVTTSNEVEVEITEAAVLPIKVAIAEGQTTVEGGFVAGEVNNGTFRYVKIEKLADAAGFTTEYVLTAPEDATFSFNDEGVMEISGTAGEYTLTTTTQNNVDTSDKQIAVYKFNIAASQAAMKSVDTNPYFSMFDYAHLMRVTAAGTGADAAFTGGLLSADVNADMAITTDDAAAVIAALRDGKYVGIYDFAISGAHDDGAELN